MLKTDREIWMEYTKSVKKLKNKNIVARCNKEVYRFPRFVYLSSVKQKTDIHPDITVPSGTAPVIQMKRKEKRKFREDAVIDLHGFTKEKISQTLQMFCAKCISVNLRNIIVITGKGNGIVKKETLDWIFSDSSHVLSFFPIYDSKKEVGAFALRLRKLN